MRSTLLSAAIAACLAVPAMAQPAPPSSVPAYGTPGTAPAYPPAGTAPAYPPYNGQSAPQAYAPYNSQAMPPAAQPMAPSAQAVPPGANPDTGARPGNQIGTGDSLPMGSRASNIDQRDMRSTIAPNLPSPDLGPDAPPVAYLRAAQSALAGGRTGEAQQALEQAQTRMLDRAVPYGQTDNPSDNPAVTQIRQALHALAAGDRAQCMQLIQAAIPAAQASAR